jgi:hypothetical protein
MTNATISALTGAFFGPTTATRSDEVDLERQQREFDGDTFSQDRDGHRLSGQLEAVRTLMLDGSWRTLTEIAEHCHLSEASLPGISARLRDLRKPKFGAYTVNRRHLLGGIWKYQVLRGGAATWS